MRLTLHRSLFYASHLSAVILSIRERVRLITSKRLQSDHPRIESSRLNHHHSLYLSASKKNSELGVFFLWQNIMRLIMMLFTAIEVSKWFTISLLKRSSKSFKMSPIFESRLHFSLILQYNQFSMVCALFNCEHWDAIKKKETMNETSWVWKKKNLWIKMISWKRKNSLPFLSKGNCKNKINQLEKIASEYDRKILFFFCLA